MAAACLFALIRSDRNIDRIVKDGTAGADGCKWHRPADQCDVSANFFLSEKEAFCLDLLTFRWRKRLLFVL